MKSGPDGHSFENLSGNKSCVQGFPLNACCIFWLETKFMRDKQTILYSFKATVPVMAGYIFLGIGYGILMSSRGYA